MLLNILIFLITLLVFAYYKVHRTLTYWERLGVPSMKPEFPYGNVRTMNSTEHSSEVMEKLYRHFKGKGIFAGIYMLLSPSVLVLDIDFVKRILVKDFQYFINRGVYYNEKDDPISAHLFNIEDERWRNLRGKLTPTFTSGKMKYMFPTMVSVSNEFKKCVDQEMLKNEQIEMKDILARFTTDVIGTCAFGLECNSLVDPKTEFREKGRKFFDNPKNSGFKVVFVNTFRNLARALHIRHVHKDVSDFFTGVVKSTVEYRETNNVQRNDFMNLLMQLKNKGKLEDDFAPEKQFKLTLEEVTAQSFVFFLAGFETSSTTMGFAVYELAKNQEVQEKARIEVRKVLKKYNGEFSYEAIMEMKYIAQIINESLRMYSPVPNLTRIVKSDYLEKETGILLKKGTKMIIPSHAIHNDPEFYPNPEVFDPDRFNDENTKQRNPYTFLPFGEGPRNCIGLRFGLLQARIGMAILLNDFKFTMGSKTITPIKFVAKNFILTSQGGLYLNIHKAN